tara:strand:- start:5835 stop:7007 length:1173 start_codon:yes stop_codon:yes gene_type:complete
MRILILSFYFSPDIGPGALRAKTLCDELNKNYKNLNIDIVTTMPNRYYTYRVAALSLEKKGPILVKRIDLPKHKSGMLDQTKAFIVYAREVLKFTRGKKWDLVFATSSRLMTASLAAYVSRRSKSKLYLDIRDLFTETMEDLLSKKLLRLIMPILKLIEKRTFRSADKVNVVSQGFLPHFKKVVPKIRPTVYTNGIDEFFLEHNYEVKVKKETTLILYAGNIGKGQGLANIVPKAALGLGKKFIFRIIGDGSERRQLDDAIKEHNITNVEIFDPLPRSELIKHYQEAEILFLHLNSYNAFKKVIPSKVFEYAATGKPILAGVSGYAAYFLSQQVSGTSVFNPNDFQSLKVALNHILEDEKHYSRKSFISTYSRKHIMKKMANDIYKLVEL